MARLGEQAAAAWKSVNRNPLLASLSRFGVLISPPKQAKSLKPRSSATMTRKLGLLDLLVVSMLLSSLSFRVLQLQSFSVGQHSWYKVVVKMLQL